MSVRRRAAVLAPPRLPRLRATGLGRLLTALAALVLVHVFSARVPAHPGLAVTTDPGESSRGDGPAQDPGRPRERTRDEREMDEMNRVERMLALRAALIIVLLAGYVVVQIHFL